MSRLFYFIVSSIGFLLLFTQCKEGPATQQNAAKPVAEVAKEVVEKVKEVEKTIDTTALVAAEVAIKPAPIEKEATSTKQVTAKTETATNRETAPKPVKKKVKKRAKIKFNELVHKFGTIKTGDKVNHKFKFKNTGNAPLVIKNVDVSCGCTFPSYPFIPIKPGEEGVIDVTFDSEHKVGRQKPTVTVVTNGRPRTIKLNLEGFVE